MSWRSVLLFVVALAVVVTVSLAAPIPQDLSYHKFGDTKSLGNIPNFMNVSSNLPFLIVGALGLRFIQQHGHSVTPSMKPAWIVFFVGMSVTAFGSGYYHLNPTNESLVWDRLPMTIGFMSLVAIVIAEYYSVTVARASLLPLLLVGFVSVIYWTHTESLQRGDLRPYVIVQFLPMLLIPLTVLLYPAKSDLRRYIGWMIGFYVLAKLAEFFDADIYTIGRIISGHSLKHVIAALAPAALLYGLMQRRLHLK